jgi:hypothetical protein
VAEPVCGTFWIASTVEPYPDTFVKITIIPFSTMLIKYTFFTFSCFLAAVWRVFCTVPVISAAFFADVYIAILVLRAQTVLTHTTLSLYTFIISTIVP